MNPDFKFPDKLSFMNVLPLWAWIAILGGVILLLLIIIIAVAVSKSKKKKKAKAESAAAPVQEPVPEQNTVKEEVPEEKPQPVEEKPEVVEEKAQPVEEPVKEEKMPAKPKATPAKKPAAKKTPKVVPVKPKTATTKAADKPAPKVYHISKRKDDNRWQIKAEGAARAIRLFNTQKEAIDYGKTLAENQGARVMIHKEDGSFRKLTY